MPLLNYLGNIAWGRNHERGHAYAVGSADGGFLDAFVIRVDDQWAAVVNGVRHGMFDDRGVAQRTVECVLLAPRRDV